MRKPTLREEQRVFHKIMHVASLIQVTGNSAPMVAIVHAMDSWSYAHRVGNGEMTDREQQQCVNKAFWRLKDIVDPA